MDYAESLHQATSHLLMPAFHSDDLHILSLFCSMDLPSFMFVLVTLFGLARTNALVSETGPIATAAGVDRQSDPEPCLTCFRPVLICSRMR